MDAFFHFKNFNFLKTKDKIKADQWDFYYVKEKTNLWLYQKNVLDISTLLIFLVIFLNNHAR